MERAKMAPDGGPATDPRIASAIRGVKIYPTIDVYRRSDGHHMVIAESDFDEALFSLNKPAEVAETKPEAPARKRIKTSDASRDELATMPLDTLRRLPEWASVEDKSKIRTKDDAVRAILAVRDAEG